MAEQDWADKRARELHDLITSGEYYLCEEDQINAIAAELRKERERADSAQETADSWQSALEEAEELLGARTNGSIGIGITESIKVLKAKAAALEAALLKLQENFAPCGRCATKFPNGWLCANCIIEAALHNHGGTLALHDASVRRAALLEAADLAKDQQWQTDLSPGQRNNARIAEIWLRERAEEGAKG